MAKKTQSNSVEQSIAEIRALAEADLRVFAKLVNPHRVYGQVHMDVFKWWMDCEFENKKNTALLLPRDHQKSHCAAVKAAWLITRDPTKTILYVSATSALAEKQLKAIKDILTCETYRQIWPEMISPEEGKREKWTNTEICVDHPMRGKEGIRDSTVFAAGLTTNITGFHATDVFLDDMVVPNNAYTEAGRTEVMKQYSQLASIETTGASETVVGTKYHPSDIYQDLMDMVQPIFDEDGNVIEHRNVYEFKVEVVEKNGVFLWPRESRPDGKMFGFNMQELALKKAKYLDKTQFYAQYYQETNDPESYRLQRDKFQYYDQRFIKQVFGKWQFKDQPLNVFAGIDFAYSLSEKADFSAIVVIGVDPYNNIYILDIDRFRGDRATTYYEHLMEMHQRWGFKKLRAEINGGQKAIVNDIKDLFRVNGNIISIDERRHTANEGTKEERIESILIPRYDNGVIWHYKGGYIPVLEEELVLARPPHDDIKDCLASVVEIAKAPKSMQRAGQGQTNILQFTKASRFGGVPFR